MTSAFERQSVLPLPARGERVGVRGQFHESERPRITSNAQIRGEAPSPPVPRKRERERLRRTAQGQSHGAAASSGGAP